MIALIDAQRTTKQQFWQEFQIMAGPDARAFIPTAATLILVPPNLVQQWCVEIAESLLGESLASSLTVQSTVHFQKTGVNSEPSSDVQHVRRREFTEPDEVSTFKYRTKDFTALDKEQTPPGAQPLPREPLHESTNEPIDDGRGVLPMGHMEMVSPLPLPTTRTTPSSSGSSPASSGTPALPSTAPAPPPRAAPYAFHDRLAGPSPSLSPSMHPSKEGGGRRWPLRAQGTATPFASSASARADGLATEAAEVGGLKEQLAAAVAERDAAAGKLAEAQEIQGRS